MSKPASQTATPDQNVSCVTGVEVTVEIIIVPIITAFLPNAGQDLTILIRTAAQNNLT